MTGQATRGQITNKNTLYTHTSANTFKTKLNANEPNGVKSTEDVLTAEKRCVNKRDSIVHVKTEYTKHHK